MWNYLQGRGEFLGFLTYQHASLAFQTVLVGTIVAVLIAIAVHRLPLFSALTLTTSRVALTIPSLALLALLIVPFGLGVVPSFIMLAFFAAMPVIGNAIVGLRSVPDSVIESARGIGLSRRRILFSVSLPMAWPVILTGTRTSCSRRCASLKRCRPATAALPTTSVHSTSTPAIARTDLRLQSSSNTASGEARNPGK